MGTPSKQFLSPENKSGITFADYSAERIQESKMFLKSFLNCNNKASQTFGLLQNSHLLILRVNNLLFDLKWQCFPNYESKPNPLMGQEINLVDYTFF